MRKINFIPLAVLFFGFFFFVQNAQAFQLDWSGYFKSEAYILKEDQNKQPSFPSYKLYNNHDVMLSAKARASDGLTAAASFSLYTDKDPKPSILKGDSRVNNNVTTAGFERGKSPLVQLEATHFYATYAGESFQVDFGRQPYKFGLEMTYSDGDYFSDVVYDVRDAVSLTARMDDFFIKPYLMFQHENGAGGAVMGGWEKDQLGAHILYDTYLNRKGEASSINAYGYYKMDSVSTAFEAGAKHQGSQFLSWAGVLELSWKTPFYSSWFKVYGGYMTTDNKETADVNESYELNPNYNPTFIFWDYFYGYTDSENTMRESKTGFSDGAFITFNVGVPLGKNFKIDLYDTIAQSGPFNTLRPSLRGNEVVLALTYDSKTGFYWINKAAFLWNKESGNYFGAVTRAAFTF